jgi:hypothetical protein
MRARGWSVRCPALCSPNFGVGARLSVSSARKPAGVPAPTSAIDCRFAGSVASQSKAWTWMVNEKLRVSFPCKGTKLLASRSKRWTSIRRSVRPCYLVTRPLSGTGPVGDAPRQTDDKQSRDASSPGIARLGFHRDGGAWCAKRGVSHLVECSPGQSMT